MTLFLCPACGGHTELHESPLAELAEEFSCYVQCSECGCSSDEEGFTEVGPDDLAEQETLL